MKLTTTIQKISDTLSVRYTGINIGDRELPPIAYFSRMRTFVTFILSNAETKDITVTLIYSNDTDDIVLNYGLKKGSNVIEITELLSADVSELDIICDNKELDIPVKHAGDVFYRNILIPANPYTTANVYQVPPFKIFSDVAEYIDPYIAFEIGALGGFTLNGEAIEEETTQQYYTADILNPAGSLVTLDGWSTIIQSVPCGVPYVYVSWRGRLGGQKTALWLRKDYTDEVTDTLELQTNYNGVDVRKGYNEKMTLYLNDLCAYDVYYYSDIITSNEVQINNRTVNVSTKSITFPNGDTLGSVEVVVEFQNIELV